MSRLWPAQSLRSLSTRRSVAERLALIERDDKGPGGVNAFVSSFSSPTPANGGTLSALTLAVKDNICTSELPTTCASNMLKDFRPPYDATVVKLLRDAGAVMLGKTNCDEFGMGSMNTHSSHGPVINPYVSPNSRVNWTNREQRSAGGSSGGSAAAVAASMCDIALSTDTGGSTRLPASYCGVAGLKPSYGLISRWGVISFADSLDCVGILAKQVADVHDTFKVAAQFDHKDPTSIPNQYRKTAKAAAQARLPSTTNDLSGLRIGVPKEYFPVEINQHIVTLFHKTLTLLQARGAELTSITLPSTKYALSAYYVIASAEASSNLARYDGVQYGSRVSPSEDITPSSTADLYAYTRSQNFGEEVRKRILLGTYALSADAFDNYFLQAQKIRNLIRADFDRVFSAPNVLSTPESSASTDPNGVDVILHPSAIRTAPILSSSPSNSLDAYVQDVLTIPASLAGIPSLSVPMGVAEDDGWPVGVSVAGQWGSEELVMQVGKVIEECHSREK